MNNINWKPSKGETYFIVSAYSEEPYEFVWEGSKADLDRFAKKTLYRTRAEAEEVIRSRQNA